VIDVSTFQSLRPHLFSVAYRMLGSAAEAEDVVQDAWLRTESAPDDLASARAWLTTVVTRLCLDRAKSARARREEYVGPWLPEPVPTSAIDTAEDVAARRESVTMAFLVLLETLSPAERAAFLLREVFDADYADVARVLDTTQASARQLAHRAKTRLAEGRVRFDAAPERQREIVDRFLEAVTSGDLSRLEEHLATDVTFTADGGGKVAAARRVVVGLSQVARVAMALWHKGRSAADPDPTAWREEKISINGESAILLYLRDALDTVLVFSTDDARVTAIRAIRNPDKLAWLRSHEGLLGRMQEPAINEDAPNEPRGREH
jgi:RNA polymerase sigma-70 factor (TIGR02957 family)